MLKYKSSNAESIKNLYSSIKNNNLELFKEIIDSNTQLLVMHDNKQNNLLSYCLDKKSIDIFNFIQDKKPSLLLEKNIEGFNCFTNLINKGSLKNIEFFLENTSQENKESLFQSIDDDGNNLFMQILKKGESFLNCYNLHFKIFNEVNTYNHINSEGQTVSHLIALYNAGYAQDILNIRSFNKKNNKSVTPFLLSARYSSFDLFKKIAEKSNISEKTELLSNAIHFASYEGDTKKLSYLLEKGLNPNEKNLYNNSPLSTALIEKNFDFSLELLKVVNEIEFEDVLYIVRNSEKYPHMFSYLLKDKKIILETLKDEDKKIKFLAHVFYYASEMLITENKEFFERLIKNESNLLNSLFLSSIAGRRDFLFKANYLIKNYGWLDIKPSFFTNFKKEYPSGFVYAINQLPKNQLEYLVNNTPIIESIKDKDLIVFKLICINKNSTIFNKVKKLYDFSLIENDSSILDLINKITADKIINNIDFFEEILFINKKATDIATDKIAQYIYYSDTSIKNFKDVFIKIKNKEIKKEIYIKLNEILLSNNQASDLELIFKNKYTIMENVLNNLLLENPDNFKNFKYLIENPAIVLEAESSWSYLRSNEFDKKSFFIIPKTSNLLNYINTLNLSEENYISSDFLKVMMQTANKNEKVDLLINFLSYSSKNNNISPNTYNYYLTDFTEKEQKNIIKNAIDNYIKLGGTELSNYQFLEKKYLNYYTIESLNKKLINFGNIEHICYRLNTENSYINTFESYFSKKYPIINILNLDDFKTDICKLKEKMNSFSENSLKDFISSKIQDKHLMGLYSVLNENVEKDLFLYSLVINKLENFLLQKSDLFHFFQQTVDIMLFNKDKEVSNLILENNLIKESNFLTEEQKRYMFSLDLEHRLSKKKEIRKPVKI